MDESRARPFNQPDVPQQTRARPVISTSRRADGRGKSPIRPVKFEITESQYHEIMGKHQRALVGVVVVFASLGFWVSAALLVLERRGPQRGS